MAPSSAIPTFYYIVFGIYEPLLCLIGFTGALADPKKTHDGQAPWPQNITPSGPLPQASLVTVIQLGHVCALIGTLNVFILNAARKYLSLQPALQEKIVGALLTPLMVGDISHLLVTLWALGDSRWEFHRWSGLLWVTLILGLSLMIPRMTWHMGIGRYVDGRDRRTSKVL